VYSDSFQIQHPALYSVNKETQSEISKQTNFTLLEPSYFDSSAHTLTMADKGNGNGNPNTTTSHGGGGGGGNVINLQVQNVHLDQNQQNLAALLAQQILNNTNVMLKHELIKIPEFYGQKGKDTITAIVFVTRVDEYVTSNNWNNIITFSNFH
jgi:hypothetical protein